MPTFPAVLDSAVGSLDVRRGATVGLYWEHYGAEHHGAEPPAADSAIAPAPDTVVIAATRLTLGVRERLARALRLGTADHPIALRFPDPGGPGVGRAIGLTWPEVPPGDYRLDLTLVPGTPGRQPVTRTLVVHLLAD